MVNDQVGSTHDVLKNFTLTLNNHTFLVNLMPMIIGSFDVIIDMDCLSLNHVKVLCFKKALHLPLFSREFLIVYKEKLSKDFKNIS